MLRITLPKVGENPPVFVLEGRLTGEWAKELIRVTRQIPLSTKCIFDLEEVFFVDSLGEETLRWLNRIGATFITDTAYGKDLCERLHLRLFSTTTGSTYEKPKRRRSESQPGSDSLPHSRSSS